MAPLREGMADGCYADISMTDVKVKGKESAMDSCPICGANSPREYLRAPDRFHGRTEIYQLLRCSSCSLVWLKDPPPPTEMGEHYGEDYDRTIAAAGRDSSHWRERAEVLWRHKPGGAVLDLGCSSGGFLASLKDPSWRRFGIEMSERVAKTAAGTCGAQVYVGDILDAPYAPSTFDAITCFHVFEHMYRPREALARICEWLKPGGIFYAMMPNIESAGVHIFGSYWYGLELPRHLYHFSPSSLRYLARSVGLWEVSLTARREVFIEGSVRYVFDSMFRRMGIGRTPLARAKPPNIPWRVIRKGFRLTFRPVLEALAALAGNGESIHAIFAKEPLRAG